MEPNANRIFEHTDRDGDRIEVIQATPKRLTFRVRGSLGERAQYAYVTRDRVAVLRDALSTWLGDDVTERREHWCGHGDDHGPHEHGADMRCLGVRSDLYGGPEETELPHTETCARVLLPRSDADCDCGYVKTQTTITAVASGHRARALELAVKLAPEGVTPARLLDAADQMAHWIATGGRLPDTDTDRIVTRDMNFIDAAPASDPVDPCPHCSHAFHGSVGCGEGGRGMHRCRCNGELR